MSLYQIQLDMAADLGWNVDRVIFLLCNIHFAFGIATAFIAVLLSRLFRKLKLHFQNRPRLTSV